MILDLQSTSTSLVCENIIHPLQSSSDLTLSGHLDLPCSTCTTTIIPTTTFNRDWLLVRSHDYRKTTTLDHPSTRSGRTVEKQSILGDHRPRNRASGFDVGDAATIIKIIGESIRLVEYGYSLAGLYLGANGHCMPGLFLGLMTIEAMAGITG
jgi:hypothetical protein